MKLSIHHYESLMSTQETAKAFILDGFKEGTVIIADEQTQGRGRFSRVWHAPLGNLYCSIIVTPQQGFKPGTQIHYGQLALLTGLSLYKALNAHDERFVDIRLKWPNDGLYQSQKLFGILIECFDDDHVIVGIGLNANIIPKEVEGQATCLKNILNDQQDLGIEPLFHQVLKSFFKYYQQWLNEGFESMRFEWEQLSAEISTSITRTNDDGEKSDLGRVVGLNHDGSLRLERLDGTIFSVYTT